MKSIKDFVENKTFIGNECKVFGLSALTSVSTGMYNVAIGCMKGYVNAYNNSCINTFHMLTEEELKDCSKLLQTQNSIYDDLSDIPEFSDKLIDNDDLSDEIKLSEI